MAERLHLLEGWPGPWEKWARSYCRKNLWRIQHVIGDLEDAVAEAALVYVETLLRYGSVVNTPQHFMALYKMSLTSWFHTLSTKDSHQRTAMEKMPVIETTESDAYLAALLNEGSPELKQVLNILLHSPIEVMEALRKDMGNCSAKQVWNRVVAFAGISIEKAAKLQEELNSLLS